MALSGGQHLMEQGVRLTPQRLMILEAIRSRDDHFSADDIHAQVREQYPHINRSTVYRTLELLSETGMVTATEMGDGYVRYHWTENSHHHHLICRGCGQVTTLAEEALEMLYAIAQRDYDFEIDLTHLTIFGQCARCRQSTKSTRHVSADR